METGAAAASGICGAKARDRGCNQNCCEKEFHVFSRYGAALRLASHSRAHRVCQINLRLNQGIDEAGRLNT